ncbi:MAG TPA: DUF502 domain-containing protein [Xanthobacteraceae bacterium]|nr:DUF502 domain-containing protein [Xanthobacteraceae bacterium]
MTSPEIPSVPSDVPDSIVPSAPVETTAHASARGRIRNYFLTGLIVAGPLAITIYLVWSFVTWVDGFVRPFIPSPVRSYLPVQVPGVGLIIAFVALTLLGFLTANFVGRKLVDFGERILGRMPVVRPLYRGLKQVFETLFSKSGSTFRTVGLVEFPAPGMWSLVFLSTPPGSDITARLPSQEEHVSVFMPCTPNPTTGFFFYVPRREVIELDIPVEAAAKLIMTAGMIQPGGSEQSKLAALAETARAAQVVRTVAPAD